MSRLKMSCLASILLLSNLALAGPAEDRAAFREYYQQRFSSLELTDFADGAYALDPDAREHWQEIEEFPPYEFALDEGRELFETAFANGNGYEDCFDNGGIGISQNFPYFDSDEGEVVTLELAINRCREANGEAPLPWLEGELASISAYMAFTSRGKTINVTVPDDPGATAAYDAGKAYYYSRRGQLNFACSSCHVQNAGMMIRADKLSPTLGQTTHWPTHRGAWGALGTLHKRFQECNVQVRQAPLPAQSLAYRNLEYFLRVLDSGLPANGPAYRK